MRLRGIITVLLVLVVLFFAVKWVANAQSSQSTPQSTPETTYASSGRVLTMGWGTAQVYRPSSIQRKRASDRRRSKSRWQSKTKTLKLDSSIVVCTSSPVMRGGTFTATTMPSAKDANQQIICPYCGQTYSKITSEYSTLAVFPSGHQKMVLESSELRVTTCLDAYLRVMSKLLPCTVEFKKAGN